MQLNEDELKKKLSPEQYHVLREKGTETPGSGKLLYNEEKGTYVCPVCGATLFMSDNKYESTMPGLVGWPSFSDAVEGAVELKDDNSMGMHRTEVICKTCGSHLGHLFEDPSSPNGKHFCINSAALDFKKSEK
jgi:peptide-methionine (R)-S-oxide reductase